jgi:hypothetical protein
MDTALTRREWLVQVFGAALGTQLSCAQEAPREVPGTLLGQSAEGGHLLRGDVRERIAHASKLAPVRSEIVIVGGGPAGLSAAYALQGRDHVLLELEDESGGTSRGGTCTLTGYPWGAHYLPVPQPHNTPLITLLREMGVVVGSGEDGPMISEPHLVRTPEERLFYKGYWYPGLYLEAGASARDLAERARFFALVGRWVAYRDSLGRRAFTLPSRACSDAPELRALDALDAATYLEREGFRSPRLRWLLDYACRDDYGLTLAQTSAWALLFYFASRVDRPGQDAADLITWPDGNYALVRHLRQRAAIVPRTLVLDVAQDEKGVRVLGWDLARDQGVHYRAQHAIVSTPQFITQRIVRGAELQAPPYGCWLVANLHVRERPPGLAWDNVLYDSPSLGYVCATHQRGSDWGPTVLTYYLPLCDDDPRRARQKLYEGSLAAWQSAIMLDLRRAHPHLQVERCDVFRWGHAMTRPTPGARFARMEAPRSLGRIQLAHSDLSGLSLFEEAFDHGLRAAAAVS